MRFFNTSGPIVAEQHYHVPPLSRFDVEELLKLVEAWRYFVLQAPRQTGKTTALGALQELLNGTGRYRCVYVNVEPAQTAREDVGAAMQAILSLISHEAIYTLDDHSVYDLWPDVLEREGPRVALQSVLARWAASDPKPLVLLIDEIDTLIGDTLVSVLRQLRAGYRNRPRRFPQSVVLCGVRDVRDYRIHASSERDPVMGGSAFNIKAESLRLGDFREPEVRELLTQHTRETGQGIAGEAADEVWRQTCGQPWLVNAMAYEACFAPAGVRDRGRDIGVDAIHAARERLIRRRDAHLDQLVHKLEEPRVQRVVEPLLAGKTSGDRFRPDDLQYVRDLGLVSAARIEIANPILPRSDSEGAHLGGRTGAPPRARVACGFRRTARHGSAAGRIPGVLQGELGTLGGAFSVQGGGAAASVAGLSAARSQQRGTDRAGVRSGTPKDRSGGDLAGAKQRRKPCNARRLEQRVVVECKVLRKGMDATVREGLRQTAAYMELWGAKEGHLVVFDRAEGTPWEKKISRRDEEHEGCRITVWGM